MGNDNVKDYPPYLDYPKPRKPITNGDRIRAMSDEELAKQITEWNSGDCPIIGDCPETQTGFVCDPWKCWLDWLKEEATDGKDN